VKKGFLVLDLRGVAAYDSAPLAVFARWRWLWKNREDLKER